MFHNAEIEVNVYTDFAQGYARFVYYHNKWNMVDFENAEDAPACTVEQLADLKDACWEQLEKELELNDRIMSI